MPLIEIKWWEGRTDEQKEKAIEGVTKVLSDVLDLKPEAFTVIIYDVPQQNWGKAGKSCVGQKPTYR
jgi:4-oxalocrotonate tautomerase